MTRLSWRDLRTRLHTAAMTWLVLLLVEWTGLLSFDSHADSIPGINAQAQEKTWQLLQKVIAEYWSSEEPKSSSTNNSGSETNVEALFRSASRMMPERLDLRFGIASSLVGQAVGTNGARLEAKVRDALQVYREIEAVDTNGFNAPLQFAAYSRVIGDTNASESAFASLKIRRPEQTTSYLERFNWVDQLLQVKPNEDPKTLRLEPARSAIVVLGAGLETNGTMKPKLIARLQQATRLAKRFPKAPVIVTGGNQRAGITEAYAMRTWCVGKGIRNKRIWMEDKARDTLENAFYSCTILEKLGVTDVLLVTSLSHIHRALADFKEVSSQRGLKLQFSVLAARSKGDKELDPQQERLGVYRDVLRASGVWSFPGLQR